MADNLLTIGTSGVLASTGLLNTTGNNISNLNTKGYVRQSTEYEAAMLGLGVGRGTTNRLANEFSLLQLRRDTSALSYNQQFLTEASRVDSLFSNTSNSIASGISDLYKQLQSANNDASNTSFRQLVMGSAQTLIGKFNTLSSIVLEQRLAINQQLDALVSDANSQITVIAELNKQIAGYGQGVNTPAPNDLLDKRDEALRKLSELVEITTVDGENREKLVFLNTGQSIVLQQGKFSLMSTVGDPDPERKSLQLQLDYNSNVIGEVESQTLGGKIGGLLEFRSQMLEPTQNKLGQLALGLADAFNTQNRLGMDGNGQLGKDIFSLGTYGGYPMTSNTGAGIVTAVVEQGKGKDIPPNDFLVTFTAPNQFTMEALDTRGNVIAGSAVTQTITAYPATFNSSNVPGNFLNGFEITLDNTAGAFANGDQFVLKPLSIAGQTISLLNNRPEDLALASPLRGEFNINNLGNAKVGAISITDTDPATSQFTAPGAVTGGPFTVTFIGGGQFEIRDNANALLGTTAAMASGSYNNLFDSAGLSGYGFDMSVTGVPKIGDNFTLSYNTGGFKDNSNGLAMAKLQDKDLLRKTAVAAAGADNVMTLNEGYGTMVGAIGEKTSQIKIATESSKALLSQSEAWYQSVSGVNLDEEAANLIRFQQSYAAAAKIISTSQTIFDTLLQAAR
jgi:flagellar hook-associated protein 1 FlgK